MALERPEAGYQWLRVRSDQAADVVICGEVETWWCHWVGRGGRNPGYGVRCVRREHASCPWCAAGQAAKARYVLPVLQDGSLRLLELGKVQYPYLAWLEDTGGMIGRRVVVVKQWKAPNAPIELRATGREVLSHEQLHDIGAFVADLGRRELEKAPRPRAELPEDPELADDRRRQRDNRLIGPSPGGDLAPLGDPAAMADFHRGIAAARRDAERGRPS